MSNNSMAEIGLRIQKLRENAGLTQAQLAKKINVRREVIAKWETGLQDLKTAYTIKLADFFNITCDELIRGVKSENVAINKKLGLSDESIDLLENLSIYKDIINYFFEAKFEITTKPMIHKNFFYIMIVEIKNYCNGLLENEKYWNSRKSADYSQKLNKIAQQLSELGLDYSTPTEKILVTEMSLQKYLNKMLEEIGKNYIANSEKCDSNAQHNPEKE